MPRSIWGIVVVGAVAIGAVWAYNRFLAPKGKTIADFGKPTAAAA